VGPIGVFDSGVGGLTVVRALRRALPAESILYLGDTARLPYGTKSEATVTRYTERNLEFLRQRGVKAVVVACNTASALALPHLTPALPTWGVVEPGAARAVAASPTGRIGVLATESTVLSDAYAQAVRRLRPDAEVFSQPCPLFVPLVEEGWLDGTVVELIAERYLEPVRRSGVDTVILGCTHYPLLTPVLSHLLGPQVQLVDSAESVAEQVVAALAAGHLAERSTGTPPEHHFCVTDLGDRFSRVARTFLGDGEVSLELVEV
jgi:glutamate racemase